jgi:MFS family permease
MATGGRTLGAYRALAALFTMNLLNYIDRNILAAVIDPIQRSLGMEDQDALAGLLSTAFFLSYALFSPVMGWLGDRMTRKYLLVAGVGVWSLATFGSGLATSYSHLLLARSVMGIGEATYAVIAPTMIADYFAREQRSRALAFFYVAIPVGSALGYMIGGLVAYWWGWRAAFFVVGLPGLFVALAALAIHEPRRGASEDLDEETRLRAELAPMSGNAYLALVRNRSYVLNTLATAMFTFALGGLAYWTPKYLTVKWTDVAVQAQAGTGTGLLPEVEEQLRREAARDANLGLGAVLVVSGLAGTVLGGTLGDRLAGRMRGAPFQVAGIGMLASVPFVALALTLTGRTEVFVCMGVGLTLAFLSTAPSNAIIVNVTVPRMRAAAFALNILIIHMLGDIPSPPAMGLVSEWTSMFWGMSVTLPVLVLSGLLYVRGARHLDADQEEMLCALRGQGP